ncbi:MAG: thioredoxin domain-containing protein [Syntrophomonadaceae bacterium]|nr:thioredoxin domain-containing protein [Syntrophomonadaceae bacterium]
MSDNKRTNRLIDQKSPYLLQHAHNPVDWYPWGEEAFVKAKSEDKPIFLSIGYSTCHWCHVMERESFEDEAVADLLNRDYIAIKVDREERPDIDHIYMEVCQGLTGSGGWPLTIIMTPEKKPFFAATYIPKNPGHGMKGLMQLLPQIARMWQEERESLQESSDKIADWLNREEDSSHGGISPAVFEQAFSYFQKTYDRHYGGFGSQPKFPTPHNIFFLLRYYNQSKNPAALEMVEKTLESMYQGGIYDHIGFGFARYSTDRRWLVPHFEKMLYDNALLALAYLEAYQLTRKELYSRVAREIFAYVLRDMTSSEGGFYSAEDADSEGEEGLFYLWTANEVREILGEKGGAEFCQIYDITEKGNFEGRSIANLLSKLPDHEELIRLEGWRQKLFTEREKRIHPHKDDKILTAWNGMMIAALAFGSRVLANDSYRQAAERAVNFIVKNLRREDGRLLARYREGEAMYPAYALDYACLIWGLIELYQAGMDAGFLELALELNRDMERYFWDEEKGGFFLYGNDAEELLARPKEIYDGAIPSANSVAILNLLRLARLSGENALEEKAARAIEYFAGSIRQAPGGHSLFLTALFNYQQPGQEIVIVGDATDSSTKSMLQLVNQRFLPTSLLVFKDISNPQVNLEAIIPFIRDMTAADGQSTAYVCSGFTCQQPTTDPKQLLELLQ